MVEPFGLDERRSLYRVKYSITTTIIRIYLGLCLFVLGVR